MMDILTNHYTGDLWVVALVGGLALLVAAFLVLLKVVDRDELDELEELRRSAAISLQMLEAGRHREDALLKSLIHCRATLRTARLDIADPAGQRVIDQRLAEASRVIAESRAAQQKAA